MSLFPIQNSIGTIPLLRVRRDANYGTASSFAGIAGYETEYSTVGGITAPKKIKCRGTDGKLWPQLVKGESGDLLGAMSVW